MIDEMWITEWFDSENLGCDCGKKLGKNKELGRCNECIKKFKRLCQIEQFMTILNTKEVW